jgi:hypothetical protein
MNDAEKEYWGSIEALKEYLGSVRFPNEEPHGYDDRASVDEAIVYAKVLGEAGKTLLAELMKMKATAETKAESRPTAVTPKAAVA